TARVSKLWGSRRSIPRVTQRVDERAWLRSTFRRTEAASWTAHSPSTGIRHRPALARQPRATARSPEGPRRLLLRQRHHRDRRHRTPVALRKDARRTRKSSIGPWYWCRPHHARVRL